MKKNQLTNSTTTLYRVDPMRLSIKQVNTEFNKQENITTTYENFVIDNNKVNLQNMNPPFEVEGMFYFKTKDEAINFIRLRMGM